MIMTAYATFGGILSNNTTKNVTASDTTPSIPLSRMVLVKRFDADLLVGSDLDDKLKSQIEIRDEEHQGG